MFRKCTVYHIEELIFSMKILKPVRYVSVRNIQLFGFPVLQGNIRNIRNTLYLWCLYKVILSLKSIKLSVNFTQTPNISRLFLLLIKVLVLFWKWHYKKDHVPVPKGPDHCLQSSHSKLNRLSLLHPCCLHCFLLICLLYIYRHIKYTHILYVYVNVYIHTHAYITHTHI